MYFAEILWKKYILFAQIEGIPKVLLHIRLICKVCSISSTSDYHRDALFISFSAHETGEDLHISLERQTCTFIGCLTILWTTGFPWTGQARLTGFENVSSITSNHRLRETRVFTCLVC